MKITKLADKNKQIFFWFMSRKFATEYYLCYTAIHRIVVFLSSSLFLCLIFTHHGCRRFIAIFNEFNKKAIEFFIL